MGKFKTILKGLKWAKNLKKVGQTIEAVSDCLTALDDKLEAIWAIDVESKTVENVAIDKE